MSVAVLHLIEKTSVGVLKQDNLSRIGVGALHLTSLTKNSFFIVWCDDDDLIKFIERSTNICDIKWAHHKNIVNDVSKYTNLVS
jgi:hypothetical protein